MARPSKVQQDVTPSVVKSKKDITSVIEEVSKMTADKVVASIASTKLSSTKLLEEVANKVQDELKQLENIKQVIQIEEANLKEVYGIKVEAETLSNITQEIEETRQKWKKEQQEHDNNVKEAGESLAKSRARENDDYSYAQRIRRRSDEDAFKETLNRRLNEVVERENKISAQENDINVMKEQILNFPNVLEETVQKAVNEATSKVYASEGSKNSSLKRENEFAEKLHRQEMSSLQKELDSLKAQNAELIKRADDATKMAQEVAKEAIQASGKAKVIMESNGK